MQGIRANQVFWLCIMVLLAAFSRIIPHPHNFTPVGGITLLGGYLMGRRPAAFFIPLLAMMLSDLVINNITYPLIYPEYYHGFRLFGSWLVYGTLLLFPPIAWIVLQRFSYPRLALAGLFTASLFFVTTNFGSWVGSNIYPQDIGGLMACYAAGLPFFQNTLLGDVCYSFALFGISHAFGFISRRNTETNQVLS